MHNYLNNFDLLSRNKTASQIGYPANKKQDFQLLPYSNQSPTYPSESSGD